MRLAPLTTEELVVLCHAAIRCLIAKGVLAKEDIMADLARQGVGADAAFRLKAVFDQTPEQ
jgi:hypothetical protein